MLFLIFKFHVKQYRKDAAFIILRIKRFLRLNIKNTFAFAQNTRFLKDSASQTATNWRFFTQNKAFLLKIGEKESSSLLKTRANASVSFGSIDRR